MILFSTGPAAVRRGEFAPFPGVRSRIRMVPYAGLDLSGADPWKGGYRRAAEEIEVAAGPDSAESWEETLFAVPPGSVLIGPIAACEKVYGAGAAAIEAARHSGRGSVVVDSFCDARDLPGGPDVVFLAVWRAGEEARLWDRLEARGEGKAGVALPLIPGWTAEPEFLRSFLARVRAARLDFAAPFEIALDGYSRSAIHADFSSRFPERSDAYFDELHHRDWSDELARARLGFAEEARAAGVPARVPLPRGRRDFEANLRAREALDAEADRSSEPEASVLRSAARRIEDFGRDLAELARQGNSRLLVSPGTREWRVVEEAIGEPKAALR
jgi:hypothetical protein